MLCKYDVVLMYSSIVFKTSRLAICSKINHRPTLTPKFDRSGDMASFDAFRWNPVLDFSRDYSKLRLCQAYTTLTHASLIIKPRWNPLKLHINVCKFDKIDQEANALYQYVFSLIKTMLALSHTSARSIPTAPLSDLPQLNLQYISFLSRKFGRNLSVRTFLFEN